MARQTQIETAIAVDEPLSQAAGYRFDSADRQYIDSQIRGVERHLVDSLLSGMTCAWQEVDSTSAALAVGDVAVPTTIGKVAKATAAKLVAAGSAYGIAVTPGAPGGKVRIAIAGRVPRTITGLAAAAAGLARVNTTTGRLERVASYISTDWPVGLVDAEGTVVLTLPLAQGGAVAGTGMPRGTVNQLLQHDGSGWAAVAGIDAARITSGGLVAARGGTGQSGYNVGDLLYASGPAALSPRAVGATDSLLSVSGGVPVWVTGISTDKLTSGTLPLVRGGTGQSTCVKGDILHASADGVLSMLPRGTSGKVLRAYSGAAPSWAYLHELYDSSGNDVVQIGGNFAPYLEQRIALTADGGYAVQMTNKTGAASVKGDLLQLYQGWVISGTTQLSGLSLVGATMTNTLAGGVYAKVINANPDVEVELYSDAARTAKVAKGSIVGGWAAGGVVSLLESNGSGLSGSVTVVASATTESTGVGYIGSVKGVSLPVSVPSGPLLPPPFAGVMYSNGVADGGAVWVVVHGLAYMRTYAGASMGGYLCYVGHSAPDRGTVDCEVERSTNYVTHGVGRALDRVISGLVLAELDLRGFGTVLQA